jgi:hypothetical protein
VGWAPDYTTVELVKRYLRIEDPADTQDDALFTMWISAASRAVDKFTGRQFGQVEAPEERRYDSVFDRHLGCYVVEIDDLFDTDGLVVAETADYDLWPLNAPQRGKPYTQIRTTTSGRLTPTGLWGWPAFPAAVPTATLLQVARLDHRRDSPHGIAGSPSEGSEVRLLASLDPDLKTSLDAYRRTWWAA